MPKINVNYIKYLIKLSQKGRKNAFLELCELNLDVVYILVARTIADKDITDEVVKNIFLSAWQNIKFVRDDISINAWLRSVAVFEIMEELRNRQSRKKVYPKSQKANQEIPYPVNTDNDFEKQIIELPELERVIFVLHDIEGYTAVEIGGFFDDLSETEVKRILKISRQTLMDQTTI